MNPERRASLRAHLLETSICGDTRTTRLSVVTNAEKLAAGDEDKFLGIGARGRTASQVMEAVAQLCGCSPSLDERDGPGVIDAERTIDGLIEVGDALERIAREGGTMFIATGHPTALLPSYQAIARAVSQAGVKLLTPRDDEPLEDPKTKNRRVRYLDGVAVLCDVANLYHTHESWQVAPLLDDAPRPDLVLADHGWAGACIARGIQTACFTDVNDPAIAVARADGLVHAVVPLDDNVPPERYKPVRDYLLSRIWGSRK